MEEEAVIVQSHTAEVPHKKKLSKWKMLIAGLCFIALGVLISDPSRHIFGINEDPYIAEMQMNASNLWHQMLSQPVTYFWDNFLKNTYKSYIDGFKNYQPGQSIPNLVPDMIQNAVPQPLSGAAPQTPPATFQIQ